MDHDRFDALARSVFAGARRSRRAALAVVLGVGLLPSTRGALLTLGKGKKGTRRIAAAADACYPNTNCIPGKGKNTSRCDFANSTVFHTKDVRGSNLSKSNFFAADLRGADFRGANLSGSCLIGANLTGARLGSSVNLHDAVLCKTTMPDGRIDDSGCAGATPCCHLRVQNCADAKINCFVRNRLDECGDLAGSFGPLGRCWDIGTGCCPCDHRDLAYWEKQCNDTFGACQNNCFVEDEGFFTCQGFQCPP